MRVGKAPSISRDRDSSEADSSVKRRQSLTGAISGFAAELRASTRPKKSSLNLSRLTGKAKGKSTEDYHSSLANAAARSKSCSYLPATGTTASDEPLLTLVLASTSSFLDTAISESGERLYVIDTRGARTNICREDSIQGIAHVGAINWREENVEDRPLPPLGGARHNATIQMAHGRRYYVEDFLRRTKLTSSRLFNIPHYPHALKWKRSGGSYKLTVVKAKTTIAILEPAVHAVPARIKVFDPLFEHDATSPLREHRGVPVTLLDYLIATALLLTAEKDERLAAAAPSGGAVAASASASATASSSKSPFGPGVHGSIHRWRMDVQPEQPKEEPQDPTAMEEESSSRPSTSEGVSASAINDSAPSSSHSNSTIRSDPGGARLGRRGSSPQSSLRRRPPVRRDSGHLLTSSPQSMTPSSASASALAYMFPRSPRSPGLTIPIPSATHHPFASESAAADEDGESSTVFSPLASVLPPTLGVSGSLGVESSTTTAQQAIRSPGWGSRPGSPDSWGTDSNSNSRRTSHILRAESFSGVLETPRLAASKSLPASPTVARGQRPATAGAVPNAGVSGRRPFRPLPRPPVHAATLPARAAERVPPVPRLPSSGPIPSDAGLRRGHAAPAPGTVRTPGSRVVSLSSVSTTASRGTVTPYNVESLATSVIPNPKPPTSAESWNVNTNTNKNGNGNEEAPRSIRRTASEATLSGGKVDSGSGVATRSIGEPPVAVPAAGGEGREESEFGRDLRRNSSLLKTLYTRRSIYKEPIPSSPSPSPSLVPPSTPTTTTIPSTAPLRIRHPRPVPAASAAAHTAYDTIPRASTSSSSSHTHHTHSTHHHHHHHHHHEQHVPTRMKIGRREIEGSDDDEGGEEDDEFERGAPPAYDTIDFSHPPLKTTTLPSRGVGLG